MKDKLYADYVAASNAANAAIEKCIPLRRDASFAKEMGYVISGEPLRLAEEETDRLIAAADRAFDRYQRA